MLTRDFATLRRCRLCGLFVSLNIIDNMLETMEKYGQTLEDMIAERTVALMKEKDKTDKLLYSLMPKYALASYLRQVLAVASAAFPSAVPRIFTGEFWCNMNAIYFELWLIVIHAEKRMKKKLDRTLAA